jgi:hypothetical protein
MHLEIAQREEKPWSMPTSVGASSAKVSTSHSAIPRRVQYLRGDGGGGTSTGGASSWGQKDAQALQARGGHFRARIVDADMPTEL